MNIDLSRLKEHMAMAPRRSLNFPNFREAAVLVPILAAPSGHALLFTVRSEAMKSHAGQIAFPGGRLDQGESVEQAAMRETEEEIGASISPGNLLGRLDDRPSPFQYTVTPVVGLMSWPQNLTLNPAEVSDVFVVPIKDLLEITPYREKRQLEGETFFLHFYPWQDKMIWGLTGNVVHSLLSLIRDVQEGSI